MALPQRHDKIARRAAAASAWAHAPVAFASEPRPLGQHETGTGQAGPGLQRAAGQDDPYVILVMTQGPGTSTGRTPVRVSAFPPGSVTWKVPAFTWRMTGVAGQRLLAHARTTRSGLASHGWWPLRHEYCLAQYCGQLVMSQMPGNLPSVTWLTSITARAGLVRVKTWELPRAARPMPKLR